MVKEEFKFNRNLQKRKIISNGGYELIWVFKYIDPIGLTVCPALVSVVCGVIFILHSGFRYFRSLFHSRVVYLNSLIGSEYF